MFFDGVPQPAWEKVPVAVAKQRYDLGEISFDSVYVEDLFGEEPEYFFVHRGNVTVEGSLVLKDDWGDEISTLYVIDGDLTVNGPVSLQNLDSNTSLYVTGSVAVQDLISFAHGQFFAGGSLTVKDLLVTDLADAGHLVVHGSVSVGAWIEIAGRGAIYFNEVPKGRLVGDSDNPYFGKSATPEPPEQTVLPEFFYDHDRSDYRLDHQKIRQAILEGRPILA